jgi:MraZ protein
LESRLFFTGEYDHKIDSQGRVAIPAKFRTAFKTGIVLAEGIENCIDAYTTDAWEAVVDEITSRPSTNANRMLARAMFGRAFSADLDSQGRIVIPVSLREYAAISDKAVVIGVGRNLELWNQDQWQQVITDARTQAADNAERLAEMPTRQNG